MEEFRTEAEKKAYMKGYHQGKKFLDDELPTLKGRIAALKVYLESETYPKQEVVLSMLGEPYVKSES